MIWYIVKNGEVVFEGTEKECGEIISKDMNGELEMYPDEAMMKGRNDMTYQEAIWYLAQFEEIEPLPDYYTYEELEDVD